MCNVDHRIVGYSMNMRSWFGEWLCHIYIGRGLSSYPQVHVARFNADSCATF
jgi:hypothetical protein